MLKIYGTSMSRAGRCLFALEEVGVPYEHIPTAIADVKSASHLKLNPNGHIPVIDDNGFVLWESMAINFYLAAKYGKAPLWPESIEHRALANQWSYWAMLEVEPRLVTMLANKMFLPPEQRSDKAVAEAIEQLKAPLTVLETQLGKSAYLLGNDFTIADLNTASVWSLGMLVGFDFAAAPKVQAWMGKINTRPAAERSRTKP